MAWVDPAAADSRTVVASGAEALAEYQRALDEWRVLTAAALVGLVEETMTIAAEFAKTRYTLGVPISTLQAHLASAGQHRDHRCRAAATWRGARPGSSTTNPTSGRSWRRRRSCSWPRRPPRPPRWPCTSRAVSACRAEAAATAYLVRARGWALAGGDPGASAKYIAEIVAGARERGSELMDFSRVELSDDDQAFLARVPRLPARPTSPTTSFAATARPATTSTRACTWRSAKRGYLAREWKPESEGGFNRVRNRIWELEKRGRTCRG